jgi:serine/threonine-protein kinase
MWPQILPDQKTVLFTIWTGGKMDDSRIAVADLATGRHHTVLEGGTDARYLPTGHLLYERGGSVLAVPFDAGRLRVTGPPMTLLASVLSGLINGESQFDFSREGALAYVPGGLVGRSPRMLVWVDRRGASIPASETQQSFAEPALSPDGRRAAVTIEGATYDVWVCEIDRGILTRLSFGADDSAPLWTPDGKRIVWSSSRGGQKNLFWRNADGTGPEERLTTSDHPQFPQSFSPDGKTLAFMDVDPSTGMDMWVLPLEGDRKPRPILHSPFNEHWTHFSPDGRWIAYVSDESGREEVYVASYPGLGGRVQISSDGGEDPVWASTGRELVYRLGNRMMSVAVETAPSLVVGRPALLFDAKFERGYDAAPDGKRFVMVKSVEGPAPPQQIDIVLGWVDELRGRLLPKKSG